MPLKILFAGTPEFAATHLKALLNSKHTILAVLTQPDRPSGRGQQVTPSPVKNLALEHGLSVYQPLSLKDIEVQKQLSDFGADVLIVVAYGLILPKAVLTIPRFGCINVHASLLPRWRGAAPIQRAIEAGDTETGVTIMQMDEALDTGDILLQAHCPIEADKNSGELFHQLADLGADTLVDALDMLEKGKLIAEPQDHSKANYANKITKVEAQLDWNLSAEILANKVRAFNPWPVAYAEFNAQLVRIWQAVVLEQNSHLKPGSIIKADKVGIDVQCGEGALRLLSLQLPGKKVQSAQDVVNGGYFKK